MLSRRRLQVFSRATYWRHRKTVGWGVHGEVRHENGLKMFCMHCFVLKSNVNALLLFTAVIKTAMWPLWACKKSWAGASGTAGEQRGGRNDRNKRDPQCFHGPAQVCTPEFKHVLILTCSKCNWRISSWIWDRRHRRWAFMCRHRLYIKDGLHFPWTTEQQTLIWTHDSLLYSKRNLSCYDAFSL